MKKKWYMRILAFMTVIFLAAACAACGEETASGGNGSSGTEVSDSTGTESPSDSSGVNVKQK